jgi:hypothetical protein
MSLWSLSKYNIKQNILFRGQLYNIYRPQVHRYASTEVDDTNNVFLGLILRNDVHYEVYMKH